MNKDSWEVDLQRGEQSTIEFSVNVPEDDVESKRKQAINEIKPEVDEPGFRQGKVPEGIIEKKYPQQVQQKLIEKIVPDICEYVYSEYEIEPVSRPTIVDFEINGEFYVEIEVDERPEVDISEDDYLGIELRKEVQKVDKESVDDQVEELRSMAASLEPITDERAVQSGDFVKVDFEGFNESGEAVEGTKGEESVIEIGSERFLPELEQGLIGAETGEHRSIEATLPDDFVDDELAGQTLDFEVDVLEIQEEVKPPVGDEDFLEQFDADSEEELRDQVRERLTDMGEESAREQLSSQIYDQLLDNVEFHLPESLLENEKRLILQDLEQRLEAQDRDMESYLDEQGLTREELEADVEPEAERRVRLTLIFQEIADLEDIELSEQEFEDHLNEMAAQYGAELEQLKENMSEQQLNSIRMEKRDEKVLDYLIDNADVETVEVEEEEDDSPTIETPSGI
ncbi:MAG: trigger factor [bacterium]